MGWWKESIAIVKALDPAARSSLEVILTYQASKLWLPTAYRTFCGSTILNY